MAKTIFKVRECIDLIKHTYKLLIKQILLICLQLMLLDVALYVQRYRILHKIHIFKHCLKHTYLE